MGLEDLLMQGMSIETRWNGSKFSATLRDKSSVVVAEAFSSTIVGATRELRITLFVSEMKNKLGITTA